MAPRPIMSAPTPRAGSSARCGNSGSSPRIDALGLVDIGAGHRPDPGDGAGRPDVLGHGRWRCFRSGQSWRRWPDRRRTEHRVAVVHHQRLPGGDAAQTACAGARARRSPSIVTVAGDRRAVGPDLHEALDRRRPARCPTPHDPIAADLVAVERRSRPDDDRVRAGPQLEHVAGLSVGGRAAQPQPVPLADGVAERTLVGADGRSGVVDDRLRDGRPAARPGNPGCRRRG